MPLSVLFSLLCDSYQGGCLGYTYELGLMKIMQDVLKALLDLHKMSMVHRDIKVRMEE